MRRVVLVRRHRHHHGHGLVDLVLWPFWAALLMLLVLWLVMKWTAIALYVSSRWTVRNVRETRRLVRALRYPRVRKAFPDWEKRNVP